MHKLGVISYFFLAGKLNARGNETDEVHQCFDKFVLKIYNASQTAGFSWFSHINDMVAAIYEKCKSNFKVPLPIGDVKSNGNCVLYNIPLEKNVEVCDELLEELCLNNKFVYKKKSSYFVKHVVRLTAFIPGQVIEIKSMDDDLAFRYGKCAAQLDTVLKVCFCFVSVQMLNFFRSSNHQKAIMNPADLIVD